MIEDRHPMTDDDEIYKDEEWYEEFMRLE